MKVQVMNCCDYLSGDQSNNHGTYYPNSVPSYPRNTCGDAGYAHHAAENYYGNMHHQQQQQNSMVSSRGSNAPYQHSVPAQQFISYHQYYYEYNNVQLQQRHAQWHHYLAPTTPTPNYEDAAAGQSYHSQEAARFPKTHRSKAKLALRAQRQCRSMTGSDLECSSSPTFQHHQEPSYLPSSMRQACPLRPPPPIKQLLQRTQCQLEGPASVPHVPEGFHSDRINGMVPSNPPPTHNYSTPLPPYSYSTAYDSEASQPQTRHNYPPKQTPWYLFPNHQMDQGNTCNYDYNNASRSRNLVGHHPHSSSMYPATPYQDHHMNQGLLLTNGPKDEVDPGTTNMKQYSADNGIQPQPKAEERYENLPSQKTIPEKLPLPPFQHAFGSTEIGRFAHEVCTDTYLPTGFLSAKSTRRCDVLFHVSMYNIRHELANVNQQPSVNAPTPT
ncbi:hypothetical protein B566_EDAN006032 [Ephemera danica]|nr:hypothetical protein B566_EDAN006032 [Ephemera danica]